jgi:hypothetical protein
VAKLPATVLPLSEWPHVREFRKLAAAHVLPGDDVVFRTVVESAETLRSMTDGSSLPDIVRSGSEDVASTVLRALYIYLTEECRIAYEEPQIQIDPWCEVSYQTVRAPHEVVGGGSSRSGKGNCLDLSLLLASCLESLGAHPLILFTGNLDESPSHAFLGCWTQRGRRFRPLLTDGDLLRGKAQDGELLALEATGACTGSHRLSFEEALKAGSRHMEEAGSIHALDVCAARPPHGDVRPLSLPNAPAVQQAYWKGEELREKVQAEARETLHILYGLCAAEGEVTCRLLKRCESSARRVRRVIEASLPHENHSGPGRETNNYRLCLEAARLNARNREGLAAAGCDYSVLLAELSRQWTRPRQATVSRYFGPVSTTS